jgi:hypothetical protein
VTDEAGVYLMAKSFLGILMADLRYDIQDKSNYRKRFLIILKAKDKSNFLNNLNPIATFSS